VLEQRRAGLETFLRSLLLLQDDLPIMGKFLEKFFLL